MSDLITQIEVEAERIRKSSGLDYTIDSLAAVDKYFDDKLSKFVPKPGSEVSIEKEVQSQLLSLGAYLGETLKENMQGSVWQPDSADPQNIIKFTLRLPDQSVVWPFERILKRFYNGPEDGIHSYGYLLSEKYYAKQKESDISLPNTSKNNKKRWWNPFS